MQAHAGDLRAEVEQDWASLVGPAGPALPDGTGLDAFVHQAVRDWRALPISPAVMALLAWAEKMTRSPAGCDASDIAALRESGWGDEDIHDAAQVVSYFNYINRIADSLGVDPEPEFRNWGAA